MRGLIVDDSGSMRELLRLIVSSIEGVEIAAAVETSEEAWSHIRDTPIDFMILDLELPGKNGLQLLQHCQQIRPVPTIVISARLSEDPDLVREVCELGAVSALPKPDGQTSSHEDLLAGIRKALKKITSRAAHQSGLRGSVGGILAIGASTGGVTAVQRVLRDVSAIGWPILITQHMSSTYTPRFAESIARITNRSTFEGATGMIMQTNCIYIAPGNRHLRVVRNRNNFEFVLGDDDVICGHRPSVDAMFLSLSQLRHIDIVAVLLTGMGNDGANGMLRLRECGAYTIAQDEGSSTVFGMPRAACALNAVDDVLPLHAIGAAVLNHSRSALAQAG